MFTCYIPETTDLNLIKYVTGHLNYTQESTNSLVCSFVTREKSRLTSEKVFVSVNILSALFLFFSFILIPSQWNGNCNWCGNYGLCYRDTTCFNVRMYEEDEQ
jgi:hypothetical protein